MGEKKFRAGQIYGWMHVHLVRSIDEMTNISQKLREQLKENYAFTAVKLLERQISRIDGTQKYLFRLADGNVVENLSGCSISTETPSASAHRSAAGWAADSVLLHWMD